MLDRIPAPGKEGRVKLTFDDGSIQYAKVEMADEPTQEGTPQNKASLLTDQTAALFGLGVDAVPNDVLSLLALSVEVKTTFDLDKTATLNDALLYLALRGKYAYFIHVSYACGEPAIGVTITGGVTADGHPAITDEFGNTVIVAESTDISIGAESPYVDVASVSDVYVEATGTLTRFILELPKAGDGNGIVTITSSGIYKMSDEVETYDVCASAGGGGGEYVYMDNGKGGGGGNMETVLDVQPNDREMTICIGAGGDGGNQQNGSSGSYSAGIDGGDTTLHTGGVLIVEAKGGKSGGNGGVGNGNGGMANSAGENATAYPFNDETLGLKGGGGGGGGSSDPSVVMPGGLPYGGNGAAGNGDWSGSAPGSATGPSGGGGGSCNRRATYYAASGGDGIMMLRFHYKGVA